MTWKENTFWEAHSQTYPLPAWWENPPRPRQGLRVKAQRCVSHGFNSSPVMQFGVFGSIALGLRHLLPQPEYAVLLTPFFPTAMLVLTFLAALTDARYSRFYLFDAVTGRFVSRKPLRRYDLLVRVASDAVLLDHLGASRWNRACPGLAWRIPCGRLIIATSTIILAFILTLPLFFQVSVIWWGTVALIAGSVFLMMVMYRRAAPSRPRGLVEDRNLPPVENTRIPFERVTSATLHWDRLLQREYLVLAHDGGKLRYYNFTGDPLHLLRLWKQRMPGASLGIGPRGGLPRGA